MPKTVKKKKRRLKKIAAPRIGLTKKKKVIKAPVKKPVAKKPVVVATDSTYDRQISMLNKLAADYKADALRKKAEIAHYYGTTEQPEIKGKPVYTNKTTTTYKNVPIKPIAKKVPVKKKKKKKKANSINMRSFKTITGLMTGRGR